MWELRLCGVCPPFPSVSPVLRSPGSLCNTGKMWVRWPLGVVDSGRAGLACVSPTRGLALADSAGVGQPQSPWQLQLLSDGPSFCLCGPQASV